jgi:hypothetical protein
MLLVVAVVQTVVVVDNKKLGKFLYSQLIQRVPLQGQNLA